MKLHLFSDIHIEFHKDRGVEFIDSLASDGDACVLAGDVDTAKGLYETLARFCDKYAEVVYVPGNHEYYHSSRGAVNAIIDKVARRHSNFHPLNRDVVELGGKRFVGTTLWFPYTLDAMDKRGMLNDFRQIQGFAKWIGEEAELNAEFLRREVRQGDIVVTHHLPSWRSVHPMWAGSAVNCFFVHDVESIMVDQKPKFWFHGHGHDTMDYLVGHTRVMANPFGYALKEENIRFRFDFTIEV